jgi:hypothetical protein
MVAQGDSWAYSDFDGFPAEGEANWDAFKMQVEANVPGEQQAEVLARAEQPDPQPVMMEVRTMFSPLLLWSCLVLGVLLGAVALRNKYGWKMKGSSALLIAVAMLGAATDVDAGPRRRAARYQAYQATFAAPAAATAAPCVCPQGACCNGACANCPAGTGWKCGPNGCVPPKSQKTTTTTKVKVIEASLFNAFDPMPEPVPAPVETSIPMDVNVWTAMPAPPPVANEQEWSMFQGS